MKALPASLPATYAPDIVISDDIYDISEVVDMKTVDIGDGNFIVSDDENIHIEETTVVNDVNDITLIFFLFNFKSENNAFLTISILSEESKR